MLRRTMALGLVLVFALASGSAFAQVCNIGVYAETDGTGSTVQPTLSAQGAPEPLNIYVVLFTEDVVNAAAYQLLNPDPGNVIITTPGIYGPNGIGVSVATAGGENVGLGECAIGFGGQPVLVACYEIFVLPGFQGGSICLGPNGDQDQSTDPTKPQINTCIDNLRECEASNCVFVEMPISTDSASFGAIKSLY